MKHISRVSFLFLLSLALPAAAQPLSALPAAEALYQQGIALRSRHEDGAALSVFQRLYDQSHEVRALGQLGLAEGAVGRWVDAERHLALTLQSAADPFVVRNRVALDQALVVARSHLGYLVVTSDTPGAQVWIDNRLSGAATEAQTHRVLSGTVTFEVRADGHAAITRVATVPPNGRARENVAQLPALAAPAVVATVSTPAPSVSPITPSDAPARSSSLRTVGLIGVVSGSALVVGGVIAWAVGRSAVTAFNEDPNCPSVNELSQPAECQQRLDTGRTLEPLAWTGVGLGGALAVGGLVLMLTSPSRAAAPVRAFRCGQGPGTVGVACTLAF